VKGKMSWLLAAYLITVALVLSSCSTTTTTSATIQPPVTTSTSTIAPTSTTTKVSTPTTTNPTTVSSTTKPATLGQPQYGGRLNIVLDKPAAGFDADFIGNTNAYTEHLTNDMLVNADWAKGPAGTGETDFMSSQSPDPFTTGSLGLSWELPDPNTIIFHIRHGVHYAMNPLSNSTSLVNGRELTAADVAFAIDRANSRPTSGLGGGSRGWFVSATATDNYTTVVKGTDSALNRTAVVLVTIQGIYIYPPEVSQKFGDMQNWKNSCGTGPFMLKDYVSSSSYTLDKNPDYWDKDPVGPGKGNQLPYLDGLNMLIIPDQATQRAAIRTHKIDWITNLSLTDGASLKKTNPELPYKQGLLSSVFCICPWTNNTQLPCSDLRVRQALFMAIDKNAINTNLYGGQGEVMAYPVPPAFTQFYTPISQLPASVQEPFGYNPDKAKQLLAQAGYPNGFKTSITTWNDTGWTDQLSVVKSYWAAIGVDLTINAVDYSSWVSIGASKSYKDMYFYTFPLGSQMKFLTTAVSGPSNYAGVNDPVINDIRSQIFSFDVASNQQLQYDLAKKGILQELTQLYYLQLPTPDIYCFWTPWVKNYHGEQQIWSRSYSWAKWVWIDQSVK